MASQNITDRLRLDHIPLSWHYVTDFVALHSVQYFPASQGNFFPYIQNSKLRKSLSYRTSGDKGHFRNTEPNRTTVELRHFLLSMPRLGIPFIFPKVFSSRWGLNSGYSICWHRAYTSNLRAYHRILLVSKLSGFF